MQRTRQPVPHQQPRPAARPRRTRHAVRRRRWDAVSWWYSLLFVVPVILIAADRFLGISPVGGSTSEAAKISAITIHVMDEVTGQPLPGAEVRAGTAVDLTNDAGTARVSLPEEPVIITVSRDGYEPVYGQADRTVGAVQRVALRPLPRVDENDAVPPADTAAADRAALSLDSAVDPPATGAGANVAQAPLPDPRAASQDGAVGVLSGTVADQAGNPIKGATISVGDSWTRSRRDGTFRLSRVASPGEVVVFAPGYAELRVEWPASGLLDVTLERQVIKAIYISGSSAGTPARLDELIQLVEETELNAVVVDIKEGWVYYDTNVQFFHDAKAVMPVFDARELVARLRDRGIYTIARLVVFNDPIVAENRPDLAIQDDRGGVWRGYLGEAWVNPFIEEVWQPNIDLAVEAANLGFDEIQYDYIRFPSDGDLRTANFGQEYTEERRVGTIVEFLKRSKKALEPTGAKLAVDLFGIVSIRSDDQGIGQRLADIAPIVDYICPMIYPSHFNAASINVGGEPNDFPYETIALSLKLAKQRIPGMELKLRPWLQDFDLPPKRGYGPSDVRAQIQAAEDQGASGWMLWNAANRYTVEALKSDL